MEQAIEFVTMQHDDELWEELRLANPEVFVLLQVIKIHQILIFG